MNYTAFDLTVDILNTNKEKINKIDLVNPYERLLIIRNEVLGCSMTLEEYITDKGQPLMFCDEKSRCLGEIKIGFDRIFGATYTWAVEESSRVPQCVVVDHKPRTRTETVVVSLTRLAHCLGLGVLSSK
jgi:hypothetical protein